MALDAARGIAAIVFRSPSRLVIFDTSAGKPAGTFSTCGDADDVFFDAKRRRVYVSCGDGTVDMATGRLGFSPLEPAQDRLGRAHIAVRA
jgi:hypothetical protein